MSTIRVIGREDIQKVFTVTAALRAVESAYAGKSAGTGRVWPMVFHEFDPGHADLDIKSGDLESAGVYGLKVVSWYDSNAEKALPALFGTSLLFDLATGEPKALLNAGPITALRTGAAAAVGAKYLARKDSHVLLQIGAGAQGRMGAEAILCAMGTVDELRVADISPDALKSFAEEMQEKFPQVRIVPYTDYRKAIPGAQIICAGTTSPQPLLRGMPLDKGVTVLLIAELVDDSDLRWYDRCIMDFPECFCDRINDDLRGWSARTGSPFEEIRLETCSASLGEVIAGKKPGRSSDDERIVVGYVGVGAEDVLTAKVAYDRAMAKGIGTLVDFSNA